MKWLLCVVGLALALAPCATADVPAGFVSHPELASRVQFVAEKPISVYCADTLIAWSNEIDALQVRPDAAGLAAPGGDTMYLAPRACGPLLAKLAGKWFDWGQLADALFTLGHEAAHLSGVTNEHDADCVALAALPRLAQSFGVRRARNLATVEGWAYQTHYHSQPPYSGPCPN